MAGFGTVQFGVSPFGVGTVSGSSALRVVLYSAAREGFLDGTISWSVATVKMSLVRGYAFSDTHRFVSDATGAGATIVATTTLIDRTITNGIADAGDTTFTAVAPGAAIPAALLYQSSAVTGGADVAATAQRLIGYLDLSLITVVPNGVDITFTWSQDRARIFML